MGAKQLEYENMNDNEILKEVRKGDAKAQDYLITKYKNLVKVKSRAFFLIGGDKEDIVQEGMIGLYKAIRDFNEFKNVSFYSFAELCIKRQLITAIKTATRQKHIPLNSYVSLSKTINEEESEKEFIDLLIEERITNPEDLLIGREEKSYIEAHMEEMLSDLECKVLYFYLQGKSYEEIAEQMSKDEKSIDNALQRVRKKVGKIINEKK